MAIHSDSIPGGMLTLFKDIAHRLDTYTTIVPFDEYNRICSFVAQGFDLSTEDARAAVTNVMTELGLSSGPTGQEEEWLGQKRTAPFGMQDPGFLAQPLSYREVNISKTAHTFSEGDKVELMYEDTRDLLTRGHVLKVNKDSTYDVMSGNGEVYQNVKLERLRDPLAEGRGESYYGRIGDPLGYLDSPRNLATTNVINDNPSAYSDAKGQEGQTISDVPNPSLNE